ncbi:hypothetical protein LCGC14_2149180, partial [marine sediment metagenome]
MKTYMAKVGEITAKWHVVDATDRVLGRMATGIATILMGKHRPEYTPHVDVGDFVIVINAEKIRLTGKKWSQKEYDWYTGHPGGHKTMSAERMREKHPEKIVSEAKAHKVGLGLIAGDIYEGDTEEDERSLFAEFLAAASEVCPWEVIRGNHEVSLDATVLRLLAAGLKHPVRIHERPNFPFDRLDLVNTAAGMVGIIAIPWFTKA